MLNAVLRKVAGTRPGAARGHRPLAAQHAPLAVRELGRGLWRGAGAGDRRGAPRASRRSICRSRPSPRPGPRRWPPRSCRPAPCADAPAAWSTPCPATRRVPGGCRMPRPPCRPGSWARCAGQRVLDLCAAPGGKTAQLAAAGARVTAVERSPVRAQHLVRNLGRLQLDAEIVVADANDWQPEAPVPAGPARRALHRHRHHPPPPRHPLGEVAGRCAAPGRGAGPAARGRLALHRHRAAGWSMPSARSSPRRRRARSQPFLAKGLPAAREPIARGELVGPAGDPDRGGCRADPAQRPCGHRRPRRLLHRPPAPHLTARPMPLRPMRRALLSVHDKTGIVELATALAAHGVELISTGGTARVAARRRACPCAR